MFTSPTQHGGGTHTYLIRQYKLHLYSAKLSRVHNVIRSLRPGNTEDNDVQGRTVVNRIEVAAVAGAVVELLDIGGDVVLFDLFWQSL